MGTGATPSSGSRTWSSPWPGGRAPASRCCARASRAKLAFELHCARRSALQLWEALNGAGLSAYGLEALHILRVEKGYLVSSEMNGQTTPFDLGMERMVHAAGPCVGRDLLDRPAFHEAGRPKLVGVRAANGRDAFLAGAQLTRADDRQRACGHVTSSASRPWRSTSGLGLALLAREHAREGAEILARDPVRRGDTMLRVVPTAHFDPANERVRS